jgi:hypothetical protein
MNFQENKMDAGETPEYLKELKGFNRILENFPDNQSIQKRLCANPNFADILHTFHVYSDVEDFGVLYEILSALSPKARLVLFNFLPRLGERYSAYEELLAGSIVHD